MGKENYIPKLNQIARFGSEKLLSSTLLRSEIINPENLELAKKGLRERGLCIIANHPSSGDVRIMRLPLGDRELRKREIVAPVAAHQEKLHINIFSYLLGVNVRYIVTDDTIEDAYKKEKPIPKKNEGMQEFLHEVLDVFSRKGVGVVFPEAKRNKEMNIENSPRTIGTLLAVAKRENVNLGFSFVGINLPGVVEDSPKAEGYNLGKKYKLVIGDYMTDQELIERAEGKFVNVDRVVYKVLEHLVSPKYAGVES